MGDQLGLTGNADGASFEIVAFGKTYRATRAERSVYDPKGLRLKGDTTS